MNDQMNPLYYPAKIWLAFGEAVTGNEAISDWLLRNGYPEVAALAHSIQGSEEALAWLLKNKFFHLAALDGAIDEDPKAYKWLKESNHLFLIVFADACHANPAAIDWFHKHHLEAILMIARKIKDLRDSQTFDYHKKHF